MIFALLLLAELIYFHVAEYFGIVDKPNERSSHSTVVLRGGGVIFVVGLLVWFALFGGRYPLFVAAVVLAAGISFWDDVRSLPDSVRLVCQFIAMGMMIGQLFLIGRAEEGLFWDANIVVLLLLFVGALVVCVGATNVYNFMDGINGITALYSLGVLGALAVVNASVCFVEMSLIVVLGLAVGVFAVFNCRSRGKAKCFAGDVGSVGIAFVILFLIGRLMLRTFDVTWLIFLLVYGVDGCLTICHRILLRENLGVAHRKHAYQIMANELGLSHPLVAAVYCLIQMGVSMGFVFACPLMASAWRMSLVAAHWIYLGVAFVVLCAGYVLFMKKYYHLHEEYLASVGK